MTLKNRWCSYDATDPVLAWELALPCPRGEQAAAVDAVVAAGTKTGVVTLTAPRASPPPGGEHLPFEDALFSGEAVPFSSTVTVRDASGALVQKSSGDAGALLRSLEVLDDVYARRFAAAHPFVGLFSTSSDKALTITVCFFSSLFFDESDAALWQANQQPLLAFRDALLQLARARGGRLHAPTSTTAPATA